MSPRGPSRSLAALLGAKIRGCREARDWTQDRLGREVHTTGDFIGKCERGVRVPGPKVCEKLDEVFGTGNYFAEHAPYARQSLAPDWLLRFFEAEAQARVIRIYETQVVTGLLQSEDYARAIIGAGALTDVDEAVANRIDRQAILARKDPPRLWVLLEEPVLHRRTPDPAVARAQLQILLEAARRPHIVVQVIPNRVGMHAGLDGSFQLLTLEDGQEIAYTEAPEGGHIIEDATKVAALSLRYDLIRAEALSASDSLSLIERAMEHDDHL
jgi:transcriptional regulator with XRE-family HTH domain